MALKVRESREVCMAYFANNAQAQLIPLKSKCLEKKHLIFLKMRMDLFGCFSVKVMLHPDIQIFTMAFNINHTMGQMKQYFSSRLKIPVNVLQILLLGMY